MMGVSHATSGVAVWAVGCTAVEAFGGHPSLVVFAVGTAVCGGWALAPDIDHPNSTVSRSAGPLSVAAARLIAALSVKVHLLTRTRWDARENDGHRSLTHTLAWSLASGLSMYVAAQCGGRWTAGLLVLFSAWIGLRTILAPRWRRLWVRTGFRTRGLRRIPVSLPMLAAFGLAGVTVWRTPNEGLWWLGLAVGAGSFIHCLGDCLTDSACPFLWPIPIRRLGVPLRWYPIGPPAGMRFRAGGVVERKLIQPLLLTTALAAVALAVWSVRP